MSEARLVIKSPSVGRRDLIIVVRGVIVLESCPADGAAMEGLRQSCEQTHVVFVYHIPQSCESRIEPEIDPGRREESGVGQ